jgi:putative acyl-CoA dehydrogenase
MPLNSIWEGRQHHGAGLAGPAQGTRAALAQELAPPRHPALDRLADGLPTRGGDGQQGRAFQDVALAVQAALLRQTAPDSTQAPRRAGGDWARPSASCPPARLSHHPAARLAAENEYA